MVASPESGRLSNWWKWRGPSHRQECSETHQEPDSDGFGSRDGFPAGSSVSEVQSASGARLAGYRGRSRHGPTEVPVGYLLFARWPSRVRSSVLGTHRAQTVALKESVLAGSHCRKLARLFARPAA